MLIAKEKGVQVNPIKLNYQTSYFEVRGYSLGLVPLLEPIQDKDRPAGFSSVTKFSYLKEFFLQVSKLIDGLPFTSESYPCAISIFVSVYSSSKCSYAQSPYELRLVSMFIILKTF